MKHIRLLALLNIALVFAGCSSASSPSADAPEKTPPAPLQQRQTAELPPAARGEKAPENEPPAVRSLDARKAPGRAKAPSETNGAPAAAETKKAEQAEKTVRFRCAYWSRPAEEPELYLLSDGEFKRCEIFELAFPRVYNVPAEEKITFYARADDGSFYPYLSADREGLTNCAAILLPNFGNAESELKSRIQIFNFDEDVVPFGTLVIYNWFPETIAGEVHFREDAQNAASTQIFTLHRGEFCMTLPVGGVKRMCDIDLKSDAGDGVWTSIFSSSLPVFGGSRTYIYMIPKNEDGQTKLDFRIFTVRQEKK